MAESSDPFSQNVIGVSNLIENDTNKVSSAVTSQDEGVKNEKHGILSLGLTDEELLKLRDKYEAKYATYEKKIKDVAKKNKASYLGKNPNGEWLVDNDNPLASNLQFEAEETFLPAALSKNPEPVVYSDNTPEGSKLASDVKTMLQFHADQLIIRRKLALMVRQWSINHLGVLKLGFNKKINDVTVDNRKIQDFIFDPTGYVDAYGDFTSWLGERITVTADKLIEMFPDEETYIKQEVENDLGTEVVYTEWWTNEFSFVTYKLKVLDKFKNQYYRYEEPELDDQGQPVMDILGKPKNTTPSNHFAFAKKPYVFLSVFSLQEQPHDITGLIEQNIPNQNLITRRTQQVDFNVSASNNGYAYSEDNFNQETAKQASTARQKGNPILIPQGGEASQAIIPLHAQDLPNSVFVDLENNKNALRTSWGIQGITSQPADEDQTARGMILNQSHDTTRIGGGIGDAIEQVADNVFNWLTQLYYVFYDEQHFAAIMGGAKAVEYVTLSNADFNRQLIVSISPDSMRPRDEITEINLAQDLFTKGVIGPKTLLTMLSFPDPDEAAADGLLYKMDPMTYMQLNFPEYAMKLQQMQAQQMAQMQQMQGGMPPEQANGEPPQGIEQGPASPELSQVPLNQEQLQTP